MLVLIVGTGTSTSVFKAELRIRSQIRKIRMFLDLLDPDPGPLVQGTDPDLAPGPAPDPSIIKQK